jgi:hypothetical protein
VADPSILIEAASDMTVMVGAWEVAARNFLPTSDTVIVVAVDVRFEFRSSEAKRAVRLTKVAKPPIHP